MYKSVIRVGKLYYAGDSKGLATFTHNIIEAVQFDMDSRAASTEILAQELGGTVVPLMSAGASNPSTTVEQWLNDNLNFILNCVGNTNTLLSEFMNHYNGHGLCCDVSNRLHLPCRLETAAFSTGDYDSRANRLFKFCFRLTVTSELTPAQQAQWDALPYGIPLLESQRLLVETLDGIEGSIAKLVDPGAQGLTKVTDYPERETARKLWEERVQAKAPPVAKASKRGSRGVRSMNLG